MKKIDAHNHPDYHGRTWSDIVRDMDELGIEKTCLLSWENPWDENYMPTLGVFASPMSSKCPVPFDRCYDAAINAPDRFILGYAPDPRVPGAVYRLQSAIDTYGVKMCGEIKLRMMYDNPDALELFRYAGQRGLPVTLHFDYYGATGQSSDSLRSSLWYGGDIFTLERVLEACPETNFLGHAPGFWGCISADEKWRTEAYPRGEVIPGGHIERLLDKYPNLYCDCSAGSGRFALSRDPEYTRGLILKHPDRFVYARDEFTNELSNYIDSLSLPLDVLELFYHGNLERLISQAGRN